MDPLGSLQSTPPMGSLRPMGPWVPSGAPSPEPYRTGSGKSGTLIPICYFQETLLMIHAKIYVDVIFRQSFDLVIGHRLHL